MKCDLSVIISLSVSELT